jgi:hypothetical protein
MRVFSRLATIALIASHLAAASLPCPTAKSHETVPEHAALASTPAHPCPAHAAADPDPATWFGTRCPCGCETGAPPGSGTTARTGPALLLAMPGLFVAPGRSPVFAPTVRLAELVLAPPEPVPLPIA